ncbi:MAG: GH32 C-terminal domain-containing protein [candidate division KSB1 bacterium]|nr:GH32 C-terminal domain-containing protein [candidate division KSB1 bacterium]
MVLYQRRQENGHTIFTSNNLRDWTEQSRVNDLRECPELFPLAIDGDPDRIRWILHGSKGDYHIGTFNGKVFKPQTDAKLPMFYRQNMSARPVLYAAQTFNNTPKGYSGQPRRIQVAWVRKGNQLSMAAELKLRSTPIGLRLCRLPVREIANLYTNTHSLNGLTLYTQSPNPLEGIKGGLYDIDIQADLSHAEQLELTVRGAALVINVTNDGLSLNEMRIPGTKQLELRVLVDHTLVEVFFGKHGLYSCPVGYQSTSKKLAVKVRGKKAVFNRFQVHELESIWESE